MNECNIIKDLMPLYEEELLSEDSLEFIRRHAANCPQCRKALQHDQLLPDIQSQNPISEKENHHEKTALPLSRQRCGTQR